MTLSRIITNQAELDSLTALLGARKLPITVAVKEGKHRTDNQNRLQHKWYAEAAEQAKDHTADEYKCHCKIEFGVPILRASDGDFNAMWETKVAHMPRETQMQLVKYINVTSLMNTKEKTQYLDAVQRFLLERGIQLTDPEGRT